MDTPSDLLKPVSHKVLHLPGHPDFSYLRLSQNQKYQVLALRMEGSKQELQIQTVKDSPHSFRTLGYLENVTHSLEPKVRFDKIDTLAPSGSLQ